MPPWRSRKLRWPWRVAPPHKFSWGSSPSQGGRSGALEGELDRASGGKGELDGTSGAKGELDGTSVGQGELDRTSGAPGELQRNNSWGRSGSADFRGRSGSADSRGHLGCAEPRGRSGSAEGALDGTAQRGDGGLGEPRAASKEPRERQTKISFGRQRRSSIFLGPSICHGRVAGRTRETSGEVNKQSFNDEHRIHYHIDELTDKDSGKTQGL